MPPNQTLSHIHAPAHGAPPVVHKVPADNTLGNDVWIRTRALVPTPSAVGRPRTCDVRQVLAALHFKLRRDCAWRALPPPPEFPPWQTVYGYYRTLVDVGVWAAIRHQLLKGAGITRADKPVRRHRRGLTARDIAAIVRDTRAKAEQAREFCAEARFSLATKKRFNARAVEKLDEKRLWLQRRRRDCRRLGRIRPS